MDAMKATLVTLEYQIVGVGIIRGGWNKGGGGKVDGIENADC